MRLPASARRSDEALFRLGLKWTGLGLFSLQADAIDSLIGCLVKVKYTRGGVVYHFQIRQFETDYLVSGKPLSGTVIA